MRRYRLVTLVLLVVVVAVIVVTACSGREPTRAELERQQVELERARERLEAERERHALRLEFWRKVQPVLIVAAGLAALVLVIGLAWWAYEFIDTRSIRWRQTQVEAGKELVYTPRRDVVLLAQRMLRPLAVLTRGNEHAPKMADDERLQTAVSMAQQAVAAKAVESPMVGFQAPGAVLPANTQPLHVVEPEKLSPWIDDIRGQLAAGDVVDAVEVDTG